MATFRSDLSSVPKTCGAELKKQLTTCLQKLYQKLVPKLRRRMRSDKQPQRTQLSIFSQKIKAHIGKFEKAFDRPTSWLEKNCPSAASANQQRPLQRHIRRNTGKGEQVHIVARLLSSTLVAKTTYCNFSSSSSDSNSSQSFVANKMTIIKGSYIDVREEYPDIDKEIRAILLANAQQGITISNIKSEYRKQTGLKFPLYNNITDFLLTIPHVTAECNEVGTLIFNIKPNSHNKHLHDMVMEQRQRTVSNYSSSTVTSGYTSSSDQRLMPPPPAPWRLLHPRRCATYHMNNKNRSNLDNMNIENNSNKQVLMSKSPLQQLATAATANVIHPSDSNQCYADNWNHLNNRYQSPRTGQNRFNSWRKGQQTPDSNPVRSRHRDVTPAPTTITNSSNQSNWNDTSYSLKAGDDASLLDFPLMGDDFFLYMARMELSCKFRKNEKVLQSGLCVSGQTINAARRRLRQMDLAQNTQIIVNIGSVDIMQGRPLVKIEHDFRQLLNELIRRGFRTVLTTLAPLANYCHDANICGKVERFNKFIQNEGRFLNVIDIHSCLVNELGFVRFDCFQNGARSVTGASTPHVFWNKIGRQRVLQMIEQNLEY